MRGLWDRIITEIPEGFIPVREHECFFLQGKCREDGDSCNSENNDLLGKEVEHSDRKGDPYGYNNRLHDYNESNDSESNSSREYRKYTEEEQKYVCEWVQNERFEKFWDSVRCRKDTFGRDNSRDEGEHTGQIHEHDNGRRLKHIINTPELGNQTETKMSQKAGNTDIMNKTLSKERKKDASKTLSLVQEGAEPAKKEKKTRVVRERNQENESPGVKNTLMLCCSSVV